MASTNFEDLILRDTRANQPAAGIPGRLYYVTDENVTERDNGATWDDCTDTGGSGGVARSGATTDGHLAMWNGSSADSIKDGGAAVPGRTLIAQVTPSGVSTVTLSSSIPGTYSELEIVFAIRSSQTATFVQAYLYMNNDTTNSNYRSVGSIAYQTASLSGNGEATPNLGINVINAANSPASEFSHGVVRIPFYTNTSFNRNALFSISGKRDTSSVYATYCVGQIDWGNTAAITRLDITLGAGNFAAGSVINLYGIP